MTRLTFCRETRKWVPSEEYYAKKAAKQNGGKAFQMLPDIKGFIAPTGEHISSRSQLREYENKTGTRQCGELTKATDFDNKPVALRALKEKQRRELTG